MLSYPSHKPLTLSYANVAMPAGRSRAAGAALRRAKADDGDDSEKPARATQSTFRQDTGLPTYAALSRRAHQFTDDEGRLYYHITKDDFPALAEYATAAYGGLKHVLLVRIPIKEWRHEAVLDYAPEGKLTLVSAKDKSRVTVDVKDTSSASGYAVGLVELR